MEVHLTAMTFCQVNGIFPHPDPCRFVLPGPKICILIILIVRMLEFTTGAVELLKILHQIVCPWSVSLTMTWNNTFVDWCFYASQSFNLCAIVPGRMTFVPTTSYYLWCPFGRVLIWQVVVVAGFQMLDIPGLYLRISVMTFKSLNSTSLNTSTFDFRKHGEGMILSLVLATSVRLRCQVLHASDYIPSVEEKRRERSYSTQITTTCWVPFVFTRHPGT